MWVSSSFSPITYMTSLGIILTFWFTGCQVARKLYRPDERIDFDFEAGNMTEWVALGFLP